MSCFSSLFGCCLPTKSIKSTPSQPQHQPPLQPSTISNNDPINPTDDGYNAPPLPAYTPRPGMSIQEKTLEAHMRDPPISNETYQQYQHLTQSHPTNLNQETSTDSATDEKQRQAWEEAAAAGSNPPDSPNYNPNPNYNYYYNYHPHYSHYSPRPEDLSSDVSSAISFPSSYGNTSTATRETPPPPYSPRILSPAPSRSMSVSSNYPPQVPMGPQMAAITQPPPVFQPQRHRRSIDEQIARGSASSTPLQGSRRARYSWENDRR